MVDIVKNCSWYIAEAKRSLGNVLMSDRELGELLGGFSQPNINRAKGGYMTNPIAIAIARVTKIDAAEILLVAKVTRSKDPVFRDYVNKTFSASELGAL